MSIRCGKCGATMIAATHNKSAQGWRRTYTCGAAKHLARDVEHLDALIGELVIARLSQPDASIVLGGPATGDIGALHTEREGLRARLDELAAMFAAGAIDGPQLRRGSDELAKLLDDVEARMKAARAASAVADVVLAGDDLAAVWASCGPTVRGRLISALMIFTVLPAPRGRKPGGAYFDPSSVRIDWKTPDSGA